MAAKKPRKQVEPKLITSIELSQALGLPVGQPITQAELKHNVERHTKPAEPDLSDREKQERDAVAKRYKQNPFISGPGMDGTHSIGFRTFNQDSEPLWWIGSGFKNLARVRALPEDFKTKADAEGRIRSEILDFIRKYRPDQAHLIIGWSAAPAALAVADPRMEERAAYHARELANIERRMGAETSAAGLTKLVTEAERHRVARDAYKAGREPTKADIDAAAQNAMAGKVRSTAEDVRAALKGRRTKTAGVLKLADFGQNMVSFEPENRTRLDHYGNEGEGWDSEGWEQDYVGPLSAEVEAMLKQANVGGWSVDIGEKGHVDLQRRNGG